MLRGVIIAVAVVFTAFSALRGWGGFSYAEYVLRRGLPWDRFLYLSAGEVAFAVVGVVGMWLGARTRQYALFVSLLVLQLVFPIWIETTRPHF